jgi:hypothetical protein
VFSQAQAAEGLQVTDKGTACTRTKDYDGNWINARLERSSPDAAGAFTITWQCVKTGGNNDVMLGWGQPTLDLTDTNAFRTSGSFVRAYNGYLFGIGTRHAGSNQQLAGGMFKANETLSLVYRPGAAGATAGTLHASRQGAAPQLIFSGLAHDLVPVACFLGQGVCWRVVENEVRSVFSFSKLHQARFMFRHHSVCVCMFVCVCVCSCVCSCVCVGV